MLSVVTDRDNRVGLFMARSA